MCGVCDRFAEQAAARYEAGQGPAPRAGPNQRTAEEQEEEEEEKELLLAGLCERPVERRVTPLPRQGIRPRSMRGLPATHKLEDF